MQDGVQINQLNFIDLEILMNVLQKVNLYNYHIFIECRDALPACHTAFEDFMNSKGNTVGLGCLIACLICFVNVITVCCICCHPTKSGKKKNFYSRMIEDDS